MDKYYTDQQDSSNYTGVWCQQLRPLDTVQTFHEYLLQYRISTAKQLLEDSELSIEEIAYESGFSSHFYMYQVFKHAGILPPAKLRQGKF